MPLQIKLQKKQLIFPTMLQSVFNFPALPLPISFWALTSPQRTGVPQIKGSFSSPPHKHILLSYLPDSCHTDYKALGLLLKLPFAFLPVRTSLRILLLNTQSADNYSSWFHEVFSFPHESGMILLPSWGLAKDFTHCQLWALLPASWGLADWLYPHVMGAKVKTPFALG